MSNEEVKGDGIHRPINYAKFRTDKEATPGHSLELVSKDLDPKYYDDLNNLPFKKPELDTLLKVFQHQVKQNPNQAFLGTRQPPAPSTAATTPGSDKDKKEPEWGPYQWETYAEIDKSSEMVARAIAHHNLAPDIEGEGKKQNFVGIWAKNCAQWLTTLLGAMKNSAATIGFYDAMGATAVDFIVNQTELQSVFCTQDYLKKMLNLKKDGLCQSVNTLISMNGGIEENSALAEELNVKLLDWKVLMNEMEETKVELNPTKQDDVYIFSYTSGTTGDSKGVKLTHRNIMASVQAVVTRLPDIPHHIVVSYLPYPHSFEQCMLGFALVEGAQIGYYQGNPVKLVSDCAILQPTIFPSVPRLYNKIYGTIKGKFNEATGCKSWLIQKGLNSKTQALHANASYTSGCYDKLVFSKLQALLGGRVQIMITGSAPIDLEVLNFLKVCFCCPILEGYGLTETSGASSVTHPDDPVAGHVGGPLECCKFRLRDVPEMQYLSSDKPYPRGEIQMMGQNITSGYYKRDDKTAEAFDGEGWFNSGDVGMIYPNGSVKIIDRAKNIFKLSQGEYIAPEKLENVYILVPLVAQAMVYGNSLKNCCVAIIVIDDVEAKKWAVTNKKTDDLNLLVKDNDFKKAVNDQLMQIATDNKFNSLEKPQEIHLTADAFTIENDILTPTFKLKRNVGQRVYQPQIDEMYVELAKKGK